MVAVIAAPVPTTTLSVPAPVPSKKQQSDDVSAQVPPIRMDRDAKKILTWLWKITQKRRIELPALVDATCGAPCYQLCFKFLLDYFSDDLFFDGKPGPDMHTEMVGGVMMTSMEDRRKLATTDNELKKLVLEVLARLRLAISMKYRKTGENTTNAEGKKTSVQLPVAGESKPKAKTAVLPALGLGKAKAKPVAPVKAKPGGVASALGSASIFASPAQLKEAGISKKEVSDEKVHIEDNILNEMMNLDLIAHKLGTTFQEGCLAILRYFLKHMVFTESFTGGARSFSANDWIRKYYARSCGTGAKRVISALAEFMLLMRLYIPPRTIAYVADRRIQVDVLIRTHCLIIH